MVGLLNVGLCGTPKARKVSHIWRVLGCVLLQTRGTCLAFGERTSIHVNK